MTHKDALPLPNRAEIKLKEKNPDMRKDKNIQRKINQMWNKEKHKKLKKEAGPMKKDRKVQKNKSNHNITKSSTHQIYRHQ